MPKNIMTDAEVKLTGYRSGKKYPESFLSLIHIWSIDPKTGIKISSLYDGKSGRPSDESMRMFDVLVVDQFLHDGAKLHHAIDPAGGCRRKVSVFIRFNSILNPLVSR